MRTSQIVRIRTESPSVKTFTLTDKLCSKAKPGQFLMLWLPGIDEIPLSILDAGDNLVPVSVKAVGDATRHLHAMEAGATVGIRGPFGNTFTESRGRVLSSAAEQAPHPCSSSPNSWQRKLSGSRLWKAPKPKKNCYLCMNSAASATKKTS